MASPALYVAAAGVALVGVALATKKKKKASTGVPNRPLPAPPGGGGVQPGPGGVSPGGVQEPAGGWAAVLTNVAAANALMACRKEDAPESEDELKICALKRLFPQASWPPPAGALAWQNAAWASIGSHVTTVAEVTSWPFYGTIIGRNTAIIFWLQANDAVRGCADAYDTVDGIRLCAAKAMFPDEAWPPGANATTWQNEVWSRLLNVIQLQGVP